MVYPYSLLYCCRCAACHGRVQELGDVSGHGIAWQRAAHAVEKFRAKVLKINVNNKGRSDAFAIEAYKSGTPLNKQFCVKMDLDIEYIEDALKKLEA
jgi:hypothetical protein